MGRRAGGGLSGNSAAGGHETCGMFGYSRDGKMAAIAAALDERISAVIAGSTGVGGVLPWRACRGAQFRRGHRKRHAIFPHLVCSASALLLRARRPAAHRRQSVGGMIAPRAALIEWGRNDEVSNTWGMEQTYYSALKVYKLARASRTARHAARSRFPRRERSGGVPRLARHPVRPLARPSGPTICSSHGIGTSGARTPKRLST